MKPLAPLPMRYRFARFELQPGERRLLDANVPVAIAPRAFDLLTVLVENAGHLVSKDELLERVWPRVIVEEAALQMQISSLRKILGREAIQTVTGRGYRFALAVADAGDAPSTSATRHDLVASSLTTFIGREKPLADLKELFGRTRLLTLTGSGGCGKTRLARQVASDLGESYSGGIWFVELAPLADPALVPHAVAQALGLNEQPGTDLTQTIAEHLGSKRLLIVLDNAEHVLDACAHLTDALLRACISLSVLVTSRERLGIIGELTYRVPSLSFPDPGHEVTPELLSTYESARLFIDRAQLQRPQFEVTAHNAVALASICRRLDGIPLAIELAAARVRSMPMEEVSRRLDDRFDLLTGGSRTALPRHQTLRSLIDWSYDLLADAERQLLCRVSIFAGGWTMEAAREVCSGEGVRGDDVLGLLTSLVDRSLVLAKEHHGATRYGLLESVRHYARDRLREHGDESRWARRHFDHMLALAKEAQIGLSGEDQREWFERLETEHDNLRAALSWSCSSAGDASGGLQIASAIGLFWETRGHVGEGRRWLAALIDTVPTGQDWLARAGALRWAGILAMYQADYAAAQELQEKALAIYRTVGEDRLGIARVLNNIGLLSADQGHYAAAQPLFEESLAIRREIGDVAGIGTVLSNLGLVAYEQANHETALALWEESLAIRRTLDDRRSLANAAHNVGTVLCDLGDHASAQARMKEALAIRCAIGAASAIATSLEGFATLALALDQPDRAARLWGQAERLRASSDVPLPRRAQRRFDQDVGAARAALGDSEAFETAWAEGRAMTLDQVTRDLLER